MEVLHLLLLKRIEQAESFQFHWQCTEMKLFNLCFVDDLLLFCKAEEQLVILFRDALQEFVDLSGLHANVNKSQFILSKSASSVRHRLLTVLGFQEGWSSLGLSFAARVQLLKSVISALNVYWAMAFILPKGILKVIETRMRKFLWQGGETRVLRRWLGWMYLRQCSVWTVWESGGSWSWRKILKLRNQLLGCVSYHVGSGEGFWLWQDPWHPLGPLIHHFPSSPRVVGIPLEAKVSVVIDEDGRNWPLITDIEHMEIVEQLPQLGNSDTIGWTSAGRVFSITEAYSLFQPPDPTVCWHGLLRGPFRIPRNCFILWLAILERLSTLNRAWWTGPDLEREIESHAHLFFQCEYSRVCLRILEAEVRFRVPWFGWQHTIVWSSRRWRGKHPWNATSRALFASVVYHIWMERNKRRFGNVFTNPEHTARLCIE
ncbi:UNVERIFIED_CONTAM: hypothetical protein Slati_0877400 [Sesamum latifolium]|uniref:Reverse transcriptase domain-containing protein n=1 Tax=Sesamum latifolium TaxID=2727402 RepID=A0AAW2XMM4_9LAMI